MQVPLSSETRLRLNSLFTPSDREEAERLLVELCGSNLPFCEGFTPGSFDGLRFAALKLSNGQLPELHSAVSLANEDWRDLLVAAGFADDVDAHRSWSPGGPTA